MTIDRRTFALALAGAGVAGSFHVRAQKPDKMCRLGFLRVSMVAPPAAFLEEMRTLGWVEPRNLNIDPRYAQREDQLSSLAAELVQAKADVILTTGTPATRAAKQATETIPIVFNVGGDPVVSGLVASFARPGANLTGFAYGLYEDKLLEALKAALPKLERFVTPFPAAWQNGPDDPSFLAAAKSLGLQHQGIPISGPGDLTRIYETARNARAEAVVFFDMAWPFPPHLNELAAASVKSRIPAIFAARQFVEAGGLLSYGPVIPQHWPRLAAQIDRILRGAKAADLPVEQPTKFELAINLKSARALGIAISRSSLVLADEVIR